MARGKLVISTISNTNILLMTLSNLDSLKILSCYPHNNIYQVLPGKVYYIHHKADITPPFCLLMLVDDTKNTTVVD